MSAIFFKHKRRRKIPTAVFSLKDQTTVYVKIKRTTETLNHLCIGPNLYQVNLENIDLVVEDCLKLGLFIECIPEQVEKALTFDSKEPFDEKFKDTDLYKKLFQYQKDGIEHVVRHFGDYAGKLGQNILKNNVRRGQGAWCRGPRQLHVRQDCGRLAPRARQVRQGVCIWRQRGGLQSAV